MPKDNLIQQKSFDFSLSIIQLYISLKKEREYVLSKQLLRSGTSIGANIEEAIAAQSRKDFIHKMSISSKEARETAYWLKLLQKSDLTNIDVSLYLNEIDQIIRIITSIIKTSQSSIQN
ncbi:four helix bundle protein [Balneola sp. EhC07]|jgi:four helix bundle protein|uniref:four helix bundle protein n=1 Tax=Balneola sp. EhC07 TaxID=1849360 RepID=UPI0007F45310|nr:four helix bundle protein [Balneola sp. EhC07]OAN63052.1 four helix bundle protein [Balneola sp. EhC07]|tara:strand:+ start:42 stop:398 length:357 start_codon:yes stop_codon:yes gene_type:complete